MKVLIAEDDLTSRTILKAILTNWGYDVTAVADGQSALAAMQGEDAPQLAILDWMMPLMDGPDVCRELRKIKERDTLYLILLTSRGDRNDIVQGLEAGADDYISKPYDNDELRARLQVGNRMIRMQNELLEWVKFQGVLEMAGAVCHELNQPLQGIISYSEILMMGVSEADPHYEILKKIQMQVDRIGKLTRKIMNITRYQSKPYLSNSRIVDLEYASR